MFKKNVNLTLRLILINTFKFFEFKLITQIKRLQYKIFDLLQRLLFKTNIINVEFNLTIEKNVTHESARVINFVKFFRMKFHFSHFSIMLYCVDILHFFAIAFQKAYARDYNIVNIMRFDTYIFK